MQQVPSETIERVFNYTVVWGHYVCHLWHQPLPIYEKVSATKLSWSIRVWYVSWSDFIYCTFVRKVMGWSGCNVVSLCTNNSQLLQKTNWRRRTTDSPILCLHICGTNKVFSVAYTLVNINLNIKQIIYCIRCQVNVTHVSTATTLI